MIFSSFLSIKIIFGYLGLAASRVESVCASLHLASFDWGRGSASTGKRSVNKVTRQNYTEASATQKVCVCVCVCVRVCIDGTRRFVFFVSATDVAFCYPCDEGIQVAKQVRGPELHIT